MIKDQMIDRLYRAATILLSKADGDPEKAKEIFQQGLKNLGENDLELVDIFYRGIDLVAARKGGISL